MSEEVFDSASAVDEFKALMEDPSARQAFVALKAEAERNGTQQRYEHILRAVQETPWAILPSMLGVIIDLLAFRAAGGRLGEAEIAARLQAAQRTPTRPGPQGVAVLGVQGVIVPKAEMFNDVSGGTSISGLRKSFRGAMADESISSIVLDVDSPGGKVDGVPEFASELRAARGRKPIVAVANTEMASAAYWLASQADEVVVSQSSRVGSIGVFSAHKDESQANESKGIKTTLISAGKFKTEGNPFEPLTDEGRAAMQRMVDDYYGMFVSDVAAGRGVGLEDVRDGFAEGRMVGAQDAVRLGMADRIGTLEQVVTEQLGAIDHNRAMRALAMTYPEATPVTAPLDLHEQAPIEQEDSPTPDEEAELRALLETLHT